MVAACGVAAVLSLALRSTLTHDSWAWVVWGRELARLDLDLVGPLPAWKPLPVLFTTPLAAFGDAAPLLWLAVSRTAALLAVALTYRMARRLGGHLAGAVAAASLLLSAGFADYMVPLGLSEPMLGALVLLAVERHLDGRTDHAFALGFAAALIRPEVWPFWLLYAVVAWRDHPHRRLLGGALVAAVPVLWLAPDLLVAGDVMRSFRAGTVPTAPLLDESPGLVVLRAAWRALHPAAWTGVALAVGTAALPAVAPPARRATVGLVALGASWVALVALMAELGLGGGLVRFLVVGTAAFSVLAGTGWARAGAAMAKVVRHAGWERGAAVVAWALAVAVLPARSTVLPLVQSRAAAWAGPDFQEQRQSEMTRVVAALGGREAVLGCGRPVAHSSLVPALAWQLRAPLGAFDFLESTTPTSGVVFLAPLRPDDPAPLEAPPGFAVVARTTTWTVAVRCGERRPPASTASGDGANEGRPVSR